MRPQRSMVAALSIAIVAACAHGAGVRFGPGSLHVEGGGRYATQTLAGERGPSDRHGAPAVPKVTGDFAQVPTTNEWWSSLLWKFDDNPYSRPMFPHPLAVQADAQGLGVAYPTTPAIDARGYRFPYARDLRISVEGLRAPDARVSRYSDWAVTAVWSDATHRLEATFGHGLPFVYARVAGGGAHLDFEEGWEAWGAAGESLGVTVHGHHYGVFGPTGSTWRRESSALVSDLAPGKAFFSVAVLPDRSPETLARFRRHAYAFVDDTRVTWRYTPKDAKVTSHFAVATSLVEPGADRVAEPILALYPHQWKGLESKAILPVTYASPRGAMRVLEASAFDVERSFHGIVPILPAADDARDRVRGYLRDEAGDPLFRPGLDGNEDTYWAGKSLGRAATLAWIARDLGERDVEAHLRDAIVGELDDWFDGQPPKHFYYDPTWHTLIGFPAGYQSGTELNDHHFHYGYFLWAAATVVALDPKGDAAAKWGPMIRLLIDDVANPDPSSPRFPRFRSFDPYAGHSWASGPAMFDDGNNEESSSEDVNFAAGLAMWGMATGDDEARDRGIYLYETLVSAIEQYWLDVDRDTFPRGYSHPVAGIVWGDGARYDTWWSREPIYVHGINALPITGASLYLGRHPDAIHRDDAHLLAENRGPVHQWRDVMWMLSALDDPADAAQKIADDHYFDPEFGSSWAATLSWVLALRAYGHVDATVLADGPSYAVFSRAGVRTYAAYNPSDAPRRISFTDGARLDVPPRALARTTRSH